VSICCCRSAAVALLLSLCCSLYAVVSMLLSLCCCLYAVVSMLLSLCRFSLGEVVQSEAWVDFAILRVANIPVNMSILEARFETK
jgi:hypothetical protein